MTEAFLFAVVLLGMLVQATTGFGGGAVSVSLGAYALPLDQLLPAFLPVNLLLSGTLAFRARKDLATRELTHGVLPSLVPGLFLGLGLFLTRPAQELVIVLGVTVVGLSALDLWRLRAGTSRPIDGWLARTLLFLGGIAQGLFGAGGPLIVYVLSRRITDKGPFRATLSTLWTGTGTLMVGLYAARGLLTEASLRLTALFVPAVAVGLLVGEILHRRISPEAFRRVVLVLLGLAGLGLVVRNLPW